MPTRNRTECDSPKQENKKLEIHVIFYRKFFWDAPTAPGTGGSAATRINNSFSKFICRNFTMHYIEHII